MPRFKTWWKPWILRYPPDTVFLMGLCVLSGVLQLVTPRDALSDMPHWIATSWMILLLVGSAVSLVGIFWPKIPTGYLIEGAGRTMLWPAALAFGVVLWHFDEDWIGGGIIIAFGVICYIRASYVRYVHAEWQELVENSDEPH